MNEIFIQIFLDEDVNVKLADMIRNRGFNAITTTEMKNQIVYI